MARLIAGLFLVSVVVLFPATVTGTPRLGLAQTCKLLGDRLGSIDVRDCIEAGLKASGRHSREGVALLYRDYLPRRRNLSEASRVLLIGGVHGDELSTVSVVFRWMKRLQTERLQPLHWRVIPCANPDGLLRRPATRTNGAGVDINRNFPTEDWDRLAHRLWKGRKYSNPRMYPGPRAASEPETQWLTEQIRDFAPHAVVAVHAPYGILDFDGPQSPPDKFGALNLKQLGTFPGSLGNYAGVNLGLPTITLELPYAGIMPTHAQSRRIWSDMLSWLDEKLPSQAEPEFWHSPDEQSPLRLGS